MMFLRKRPWGFGVSRYVIKNQVCRTTSSNGGPEDQLSPKHDLECPSVVYRRHLDSCLEKGSTGGLGASRLVRLYEDFLSIGFRCEMF
ncbi:hypothetical protein U9M48_004867 [Paspalum notatum var. saurae]|uniref:Uncharacterized protein n=1 Tax=Paspalum notatum var. saurae TaxID=547442 RepID=A0AAQ3PNU8_PASNO